MCKILLFEIENLIILDNLLIATKNTMSVWLKGLLP